MVYTVAIGDLSTWLSEQDANTVDTPYEIEITGLGTYSVSNIKTALNANPTKYVDLSATTISSSLMYRASFSGCTSLVVSPMFEDLETSEVFDGKFNGCTSLKVVTSIPSGITSMTNTFKDCSSLTPNGIPAIPNTVTSMLSTFESCTAFVNAPKLPNSVTNIDGIFFNCTSLVYAPIIPNGVTQIESAFGLCSALTNPPAIPSSVTDVAKAFDSCTSLAYKPVIASSVTGLDTCFNDVTQTLWGIEKSKLNNWAITQTTEAVLIEQDTVNNCYEMTEVYFYAVKASNFSYWLSQQPANTVDTPYVIGLTGVDSQYSWKTKLTDNPTKYVDLSPCTLVLPSLPPQLNNNFKDCKTLVKPPAIPVGTIQMEDTFRGCTNLQEAPVLPSGLLRLRGTFQGCSSLTEAPEIPDSVTEMSRTFYGCSSLTVTPVIPNNVSTLGYCFYECTSLTRVTNLPSGASELDLGNAFYRCSLLSEVPNIPENCINLAYCFTFCVSLYTPPVILNPTFSSADNVIQAFANCTILSNKPIINVNNNFSPAYNSPYYEVSTRNYVGRNKEQIKYWLKTYGNDWIANGDVIHNKQENKLIYVIREAEVNDWLAEKPVNTQSTSYKITFMGYDTYTSQALASSLLANLSKYVDLSYYVLPSTETDLSNIFEGCTNLVLAPDVPSSYTNLTESFKNCTSLIEAPVLSSGATNLSGTFSGCTALTSAPTIPSGVTNMNSTFKNCTGLTSAPTIPSTVTNLGETFCFCTSLTSAPAIPNGVTDLSGTFEWCTSLVNATAIPSSAEMISVCFYGCTALTEPPTISNGVKYMDSTFRKSGITSTPNLPNSVIKMLSTFEDCKNLVTVTNLPENVNLYDLRCCFKGCDKITVVPLVPNLSSNNSMGASECFSGCTSLRKINEFKIPLNTLKNNADFQNMFQGCTSLTEIGYVIKESNWHVWRLKYGSNTVEGKVYFADGTSSNIPSTQITKSDLQMPIKTDELWFPTESDADIDELIEKMIQFRYGMYKKETIPPDEKTMVLWADNAEHFKSNVPFVPVDEVAIDNMHSVTSNAVAEVTDTLRTAINGKASGNLTVKYLYLTPRQLYTASTLTSIVAGLGEPCFCIFQVNWEEYKSFPYAGSSGYIMRAGGSACAYGKFRNYGDNNYTRAFKWTDSVKTDRFSGIYAI